jgi:hypothetical protein
MSESDWSTRMIREHDSAPDYPDRVVDVSSLQSHDAK